MSTQLRTQLEAIRAYNREPRTNARHDHHKALVAIKNSQTQAVNDLSERLRLDRQLLREMEITVQNDETELASAIAALKATNAGIRDIEDDILDGVGK